MKKVKRSKATIITDEAANTGLLSPTCLVKGTVDDTQISLNLVNSNERESI